ncbi:MAG: heat-inducible transcription repressor HrcA [Chloroflexi bacterium]|nr:heat-inducible transcription repressor HrcA [Chloroflexota bacterium]
MADELSERQQKILARVIQDHVLTAQPVSSKAIAQDTELAVSPATVRNEMAYLEQIGLLTHPHTSAGRVPTDQGYRYFVHHLMGSVQLPVAERRTIRHQFHQSRPEVDQWMQLSAAILARAGRSASVITAPKASASRFKHLEMISTRETHVLLVLVLEGGIVRQQVLVLSQPAEQEWLSTCANQLNDLLKGLSAGDIQAKLPAMSAFEQQVVSLVASTMEQYDARGMGTVYHAGVEEILSQPEFSEAEGVRHVFRILEEGTVLLAPIFEEALRASGVQVLIGGEGRWGELSEVSVILSRYGNVEQAAGVLGLVGPVRMSYPRAVSAVQFVGALLSDLIEEFYPS